uniref:Uncharacterized protein n=1 Tax=Triticum urartu TaxID=4572 RepID=A0A8R7PSR7_TRIUA
MKMENISGRRSCLLLRSSSVSPTVPSSCSMLFLPGPAFSAFRPTDGMPARHASTFRRCQYVHRSYALACYTTMPSSECFHKEKEGETEEDYYAWVGSHVP